MNAMQPPQSVEEVKATLETTEKGGVRQSIRNCLTVFQRDPVLAGAIAYNILTDRKDIIKPIGFHRESTALTDTDMKYLLLYLEETYGLTSEKKIETAIGIVANENKYHPIRDFLNSLAWDGTERIRFCLRHFLGADVDDYTYEALKLFMLGAITRAFKPGSKFEIMLIRAGLNAWAALLCAFLAGMLAGFVTGLFHTKCGIPAILAGILTQLSLYSINLRIMGSKANQAVGVDKYDLLVSQRYVRSVSLDNPLPLLVVFTVVLIAVLYWFFGTEKGCSLRATGANPNMARAQGINTNANVVLGLMVSNGLVALSGGLLAQFQGSSDINMGRGAIVIGLAAVIIGEVAFGKVFINFALKLLAVSIGAVIYYIVLQIVLQLGLNTNDLKLVSALIVAVFLAIPYWKGHIHTKKGGSVHA